jgi:uncharacterized protein (DUF1697 family)
VTRWVALLRGINLGPSHKVPMADLRALLSSELGYDDVATLINSGNVVFTAAGSAGAHERAITAALADRFGFPVPTIVRSAASVKKVLADNPFSGAPEKELHIVFVSAKPPMPSASDIAPDEAVYGSKVVYLRLPNGVAGSKTGDLGKKRDVVATSRTVATVKKLVALA